MPFLATSLRELTARITPRHILFAGWLLLFVYAFPGYMSTDSVVQLHQARTGVRTDWHPPLMALLWGYLDRIISGPVLMLVLQTTLFFVGVFKLLARAFTPRVAALVTCAVVLFPPVVTTMAVIWKDSQMAAFFVAGTAAALSPHRRWRVVGWLLLGAAAAMRHNAPVAILPLAIFIVWTSSSRSRLLRVAIGVLASLAVGIGAMAVNSALTKKREYPWYGSLALLDVAGTTRYSAPRSDAEMQHLLRDTGLVVTEDIHRRTKLAYQPRTWWWLSHGDGRIWDYPTTKTQRLAIRRAWIDVVTDDPGAYWYHRRRVFNEVLGISKEEPWSPVWWFFAESPEQAVGVGHNHSHSSYQRLLGEFFTERRNGPLFRVYWYFWLGWVLLGVAIWRRQALAVALLASGLAYELTYFFLAPSPDFRYSHWMIACVVGVGFAGTTRVATELARRRGSTA
ncbi:MAG: hypothetical protein F9K40_07935 [Kofleriaceae bacterium]|nr:MAG: hypothetical protein F9K40_07935 [Kofleriaceae bacterium]